MLSLEKHALCYDITEALLFSPVHEDCECCLPLKLVFSSVTNSEYYHIYQTITLFSDLGGKKYLSFQDIVNPDGTHRSSKSIASTLLYFRNFLENLRLAITKSLTLISL